MSFKVLYVTSSNIEAEALKKVAGIRVMSEMYSLGNLEISLLVCGIGSVATVWSMKEWISVNGKPDLAINGGIAGSYRDEIGIGEVVLCLTDCFADSGVEDGDNFLTLQEAGLPATDVFPFIKGLLVADPGLTIQMKDIMKSVKAITLNTATGSEKTKKKLIEKFNPDIETMEGAAFFYICVRENIPFLAIRAISNLVEKRDRKKWQIDLALGKLSEKVGEVLTRLR